MKLRQKLTFASLLFKLLFVVIFLAAIPYLSQRINLLQTDNELIEKREMVIDLISEFGTAPFVGENRDDGFGSYNILKEEFISLEQIDLDEHWNFIEVTERLIENEIIEYRVINYSFLIDGETYLLEIGKSLSSIATTERNIRRITLFFLLVFVVISVAFEFSYTTYILQPLSAITKKIKKTSNPDLYDKSVIPTGGTNDFKELDQTLTSLMTKMSRLLQKEKEITQNISHELLTPVSILRSKLENILTNSNIDEESAKKIEEALTTLYRLKSMINSLLLIARIESRQYLKKDQFTVKEILSEITEELEPLAEDKNIEIKNDISEDYQLLAANKSLVFSMFFNVINNAIRHSVNSSVITISSEKSDMQYHLSITDNGSGIPPEIRKNLFERFRKKRNINDDNSGIGLAIAKSIADFHEITIDVYSNPGEGTTFVFNYPIFPAKT
ncbi:sensor histidine kinase [Alkalitalea saponilacus]|uniref:histidine kinase n=1 Tax=Alkalitalea saponilacus TaxID=889453 RepID=A0A1T5HIP6_9BACT|nr:HAMP domain-containing sensor histidine kinase [Alkalitalea saponilacus]ASB48168.1 hypothetical protein CDL62_02915 [Alkalitalea saponilacus]SKC20421.1 His Kinase A (phospho-acceptor) domain-containing protein [Alkalitalea saponilacus]